MLGFVRSTVTRGYGRYTPLRLLATCLSIVPAFLLNFEQFCFHRRKTYILNLPALGHDLFELATFFNSLSDPGREGPTTIFFLTPKSGRSNAFLMSLMMRFGVRTDVRLRRVSRAMWCALMIVSNTRSNGFGPRHIHPDFSEFQSVPRDLCGLIRTNEHAQHAQLLEQAFGYIPGEYCILGIRDGGHYGDSSSRNTNVALWEDAVRLLLNRGWHVVRMGRQVHEPLTVVHPRLFDYSVTEELSDRADVLLWANCSFAVGDSTGLTDAVTLLGGRTFCATFLMDPRGFISHPAYSFATQSLVSVETGEQLQLSDVVGLMNQGINLGDDDQLHAIGVRQQLPTSGQICRSLTWYLETIVVNDSRAITEAWKLEEVLLSKLATMDKDVFHHYRKDARYSYNWLDMQSLIYPGSIDELLGI